MGQTIWYQSLDLKDSPIHLGRLSIQLRFNGDMIPVLFCNEIVFIRLSCGIESNTYTLNASERCMLHAMSCTFLSCTCGCCVPSHNI